MTIVLIVLLALLLFVAVLIARALAFRPTGEKPEPAAPVEVDEAAIAQHMQAMIRVKTISYADPALEDKEAFEAFPALLVSLYPRLHAACPQQRIGVRGLLYHWKGKHADRPSVLMSHYDVVPAEAESWRKPPFDGVLENGVLWGRGTLDTKGTLLGAMEAVEKLIGEGFVPEQDVYLAFGGNEEIGGDGAPGIVTELSRRGVKPAFVLDEGGAVVENVFPGVKAPCAVVGIAEKGIANMSFEVMSKGGHASAPPPQTPVGVLAQAVTRVENHPFPFHLTEPARRMFDTLGRHSTLLYRIIFANLWCFTPVLNMLCKKTGGELNALVRTTCAFTQMKASDAANVLPPSATVVANLRIVPGETIESAKARLAETIGNPDIRITPLMGRDPSSVSHAEGEPWARLSHAISATWPEAIVSPYLMIAASDSTHYSAICENVYRFSTMALSGEERRMIHGHDERVPVATLCTTVRFYTRLLRNC